MNKFKVTDWTLVLFQCLFILWGLFENGKTIRKVYSNLGGPLIPESVPRDISKPYFIMVCFFIILSIITYVVIKYYSRLRIGLLIAASLIAEYLIANYVVFKQESLF